MRSAARFLLRPVFSVLALRFCSCLCAGFILGVLTRLVSSMISVDLPTFGLPTSAMVGFMITE